MLQFLRLPKGIRLHFYDDFVEAEHPRAPGGTGKGGQFVKGGAGGGTTPSKAEHPKKASGAVVGKHLRNALKALGYKKKNKDDFIYEHPNGHKIEVHAALEGQKWLTGWTDLTNGTNGKGGVGLGKYLNKLHGGTSGQVPFHVAKAKQKKEGIDLLGKPHPAPAVHEALKDLGFKPTVSTSEKTTYTSPELGKVVVGNSVANGAAKWEWYKDPNAHPEAEPDMTGSGIAGAFVSQMNEVKQNKATSFSANTLTHFKSVGEKYAMEFKQTKGVNGEDILYGVAVEGDTKKVLMYKPDSSWTLYYQKPGHSAEEFSGKGPLAASNKIEEVSTGANPYAPKPEHVALSTAQAKAYSNYESTLNWSQTGNKEGQDTAVRYYNGESMSPTESIVVGTGEKNKGHWQIYKKGEGVVAAGQGQESFNEAFENLHPRGEGGKFIKKPEDFAEKYGLDEIDDNPYWKTYLGPKDLKIDIQKNNANWFITGPNGHSINEGQGYETLQTAYEKATGTTPATKVETEIAVKHKSPTINGIVEEEGFKPTKELTNAIKYEGPLGTMFVNKETDPETGNYKWIFQAPGGGTKIGSGISNLDDYIQGTVKKDTPTTSTPVVKAKAIGNELKKEDLKKISDKLGSNPGGVYEDKDGKQYYLKEPPSIDHTRNELLAAALMSAAGGSALSYHPVMAGDKLEIATDYNKLDKSNLWQLTADELKQARSDFAINAWLANWDAVGLQGDNIGVINGKAVNLDLGGALKYRAQGSPKPPLSAEPSEWETMRNPSTNAKSAELYKPMTPEELKASADKLKAISDDEIRALVTEHGPGDALDRENLANVLISRKKRIIELGQKAGMAPKIEHKAGVGTKNANGQWVVSPTEPELGPVEVYYALGISPSTKPKAISQYETNAVSNYTGSGYDKVNNCLRFLEDCSHIPEVKVLTDYVGRTSTTKPLTLFRGINSKYAESLLNQIQYGKNAGKPVTIKERGFTSLTTSHETAMNFAHSNPNHVFIIEVPEGSQLVYANNTGEQEMLAQAGTYFVAAGEKDPQTGHYKLRLEQSHLHQQKQIAA